MTSRSSARGGQYAALDLALALALDARGRGVPHAVVATRSFDARGVAAHALSMVSGLPGVKILSGGISGDDWKDLILAVGRTSQAGVEVLELSGDDIFGKLVHNANDMGPGSILCAEVPAMPSPRELWGLRSAAREAGIAVVVVVGTRLPEDLPDSARLVLEARKDGERWEFRNVRGGEPLATRFDTTTCSFVGGSSQTEDEMIDAAFAKQVVEENETAEEREPWPFGLARED